MDVTWMLQTQQSPPVKAMSGELVTTGSTAVLWPCNNAILPFCVSMRLFPRIPGPRIGIEALGHHTRRSCKRSLASWGIGFSKYGRVHIAADGLLAALPPGCGGPAAAHPRRAAPGGAQRRRAGRAGGGSQGLDHRSPGAAGRAQLACMPAARITACGWARSAAIVAEADWHAGGSGRDPPCPPRPRLTLQEQAEGEQAAADQAAQQQQQQQQQGGKGRKVGASSALEGKSKGLIDTNPPRGESPHGPGCVCVGGGEGGQQQPSRLPGASPTTCCSRPPARTHAAPLPRAPTLPAQARATLRPTTCACATGCLAGGPPSAPAAALSSLTCRCSRARSCLCARPGRR